jgi:hypothetical protein
LTAFAVLSQKLSGTPSGRVEATIGPAGPPGPVTGLVGGSDVGDAASGAGVDGGGLSGPVDVAGEVVSGIAFFWRRYRLQDFDGEQTASVVQAQRPRGGGDRQDGEQHLLEPLAQCLAFAQAAEVLQGKGLVIV